MRTLATEQMKASVTIVRDARSPMASFIDSFLVAKTLAPKVVIKSPWFPENENRCWEPTFYSDGRVAGWGGFGA